MNSRQIIITLYAVLLTGLALGAGAFLLEAQREYDQLQRTEAGIRLRLAEKQAQLKEQQRVLERLRTDRDFVEKVIRKRLNYVKPGEVVFRFED